MSPSTTPSQPAKVDPVSPQPPNTTRAQDWPMSPEQDDEMWEEYLKVASKVDEGLIRDWQIILEGILIFIGILSSILASFIIQTSTEFQRDPADITNDLLVAIYKRSLDSSTPPINPNDLFKLKPADYDTAVYQNGLLYASLGFCLIISALASVCKLWIIHYRRAVDGAGSPFERATERQKAYNAMRAWKLEAFIEVLPLFSMIAVFLFGLFLFSSINNENLPLSFMFGIIVRLGLAIVLLPSLASAFIPSAPFKSSFSNFLRFVFHFAPNPTISLPFGVPSRPKIGIRTIAIAILSLGSFVATGFIISIILSPVFLITLWISIASVFALLRKGTEKDTKPRVFELPGLILVGAVLAFSLFTVSFRVPWDRVQFGLPFGLGGLLLYVLGGIGIKMSGTIPRTAEADAVGWMISSSATRDLRWYDKALDIASKSANVKPRLFEQLFPILKHLIIVSSSHEDDGDGKGSSDSEGVSSAQEAYITRLAGLVDFEETKGNLFRNEARVEHGHLPRNDPLRDKLVKVSERTQCPLPSPMHETDSAPCRCVRCSTDLILAKFPLAEGMEEAPRKKRRIKRKTTRRVSKAEV